MPCSIFDGQVYTVLVINCKAVPNEDGEYCVPFKRINDLIDNVEGSLGELRCCFSFKKKSFRTLLFAKD